MYIIDESDMRSSYYVYVESFFPRIISPRSPLSTVIYRWLHDAAVIDCRSLARDGVRANFRGVIPAFNPSGAALQRDTPKWISVSNWTIAKWQYRGEVPYIIETLVSWCVLEGCASSRAFAWSRCVLAGPAIIVSRVGPRARACDASGKYKDYSPTTC